jgi:hypothetical protein
VKIMPPKSEITLLKAPAPPSCDRLALDGWLDDGGSVRPHSAPTARKRRTSKRPADTAAGCRDRASADLIAAAAMMTRNGQLRMEASSACWAARAELLQQMDDNFNARMKLNS